MLTGTWTTSSPYRVTTDTSAVLKLLYLGEQVTLTLGKGSDHGICDLYLNGAFVQSFDGYAASSTTGDVVLTPSPASQGPHLLEIRNTSQKNASSSGYKVRFQQLLIPDLAYSLHTVEYVYDALARLKEARYNPAGNTVAGDADLLRRHQFTYDLAGNRLSEAVALNGGSPTTQSYTYNAANQISSGSYAYDNNGNLTSDGTNSYTWDRANRLLSMGGAAYKYDGYGNRIQQTVGANVTKYLLDLQPELPVVVAETVGANVTRFVHAPRGIHAHKDASNNWEWMVQDGLGSVRGVDSNTVTVLESRSYTPYGVPFGATGSSQTPYGFTSEPTDSNGLLYLRARYYNPAAGVFTALDPFEGISVRPMSLNGYSWVEGNVPNWIDPSGRQASNWPDYSALQELMPDVQASALRWNRISEQDRVNLQATCDPLRTGRSETGFTDAAYAALMAAILHNEKALIAESGADPLRHLYETLGDALFLQPTLISLLLPSAGDRSIGISNIKEGVYIEILQERIPIGGPEDFISFSAGSKFQFLAKMLQSYFPQGISEDALIRRGQRYVFITDKRVSIELLAANLYRGIIRAKSARTITISNATVFNLAAWHNAGDQETAGYENNPKGITKTSSVQYANDVLVAMAEIVDSPLVTPSPTPWQDFWYCNDIDITFVDMFKFLSSGGSMSPHTSLVG